ncbi:MAG: hypothetical protein RL189_1092 [Pseudomonadota bacterium]|jgi:hypothetical protein
MMSDKTTTPAPCGYVVGLSLMAVLSGLLSLQAGCVSGKKQTPSSQLAAGEAPERIAQKNIIQGGQVLPRAEAGQGLVWFPFVWSPELAAPDKASGLTAINYVNIREPKLIFRNSITKNEILIALSEESGSDKRRFELTSADPQKQLRFYLPRVLALTQGDYVVEGIRTELGTQTQERGTLVNLPFVNPFQASGAKPLVVQVREGRVSTVARVVQTTSIADSAQGLSLKTIAENLDSDVVPVGLVLQHLNRSPAEGSTIVRAGTTDFPRLRFDLTNQKGEILKVEEHVARVGFIADSPCGAEGTIRLVWKRLNDEREYLSQFPFGGSEPNCKDKFSTGFSFALPAGDWQLKSTMLALADRFKPQVQTPWMRNPSALLNEYFSLSDQSARWTFETQREIENRKGLIIPLDSATRKYTELRRLGDIYSVGRNMQSSDSLFLGHFDIRIGESKNDKSPFSEFELKTSFDLSAVQSLLSVSRVFNAYTLEKIANGKAVKTKIILRTAANQEDRPSLAPAAAELQGEAKKAYATCVKEREESDPLVTSDGILQFTVLKGSDSVNLRSRSGSPEALLENWLESCLKKKFIGFRFSRKVPVNFQGELKFGMEN